jgi:hypothetical protein
MDKPHKAHHKASSGAKAAKKDAAKGVDRSGGQGYNPKVCPCVPDALKQASMLC